MPSKKKAASKKSTPKKVASKRPQKVAAKSATKDASKRVRQVASAIRSGIKQAARSKTVKATAIKEVKRQATQSKRTTKSAIKAFKSLSKNIKDALELSKIERLLGEDFESLAQARKALKQQSKPTRSKQQPRKPSVKTKPSSGAKSVSKNKQKPLVVSPIEESIKIEPKKQGKKSFSFRSMNPKKGENLIDFYDRLESNSNEYNKLLKPGERWVFTFANGKSRRLFGSLDLAIKTMRRYDLSKQIASGDDEFEPQTVESIKFTKFSGSPLEYVIPNEERIKMRNKERLAGRRRIISELKKTGAMETDFGSNYDVMLAQEKLIAKLKKELEGKKNANTRNTTSRSKAKSTQAKKPSKANAGVRGSGKGKAGKAKK